MLSGIEAFIALLLALAVLLVSIIDFALSGARKITLRRLTEGPNGRPVPLLLKLVDARSEVLMTVHITLQVLLVLIAVLLASTFVRSTLSYPAALAGTLILLLIVILGLRQLVPRIVAGRDPEKVLIGLFPLLRVLYVLLRPVAVPLGRVLAYFRSWEEEGNEEDEATEEEIQAFIDTGEEEGILERQEGEMLQSIVEFGDKMAREVMTPRSKVVAVDVNSSVDDLLDLILSREHTRLPVFRDDLDNIEGVIHERQLLRVWRSEDRPDNLRSLIRPVYMIPETKRVSDLLQEMKKQGHQIALVVDEYGGVSGLITMEDLIEEIVGEIADESGSTREKIIEEGRGVYIVPGDLDLEIVNRRLGMSLVEDTECTTVAGAVVELFGHFPGPGERIEHQGVAIEVLEADRRRVHRLRIELPVPNFDGQLTNARIP